MGQSLAVIPARKGSKRLPGKNGLRLGGKTLVELAVQCASACPFIASVCVSTDDKELADNIDAHKIIRPPWLAVDNATTEATALDALCQMWRLTGKQYDSVMVLQPTSPLRTVAHLNACCDLLDGHDSVVSVSQIQHPPHKTCFVLPHNGMLSVPSKAQGVNGYRRDGVCYLARADVVAQHDLYGKKCRPFYTPAPHGMSIDTKEDWEETQRIWRSLNEEFTQCA